MEDKHLKVLLIEDNPGDANLIRHMLSEEKLVSFNLKWAEELSTGLKHLAKRDIDALLLDLSLPDSQGLNTFTKVQNQAPELPIIVLSGLKDETLAVEAVRKGAQDYLVKGQVDSHLLSRAIRYAIQRKRIEETLLRSEKLKVLGEMAGGVAHDFNNLLTVILGNAQLLERGLGRYNKEEIKKRLRIIAQTAYEGGETVRRMRHFTRRGVLPEDFSEIDLNEIIREAIASTSPCWKDEAESKGITVRISRELGKLPLLSGNRAELMEVLTNLIFNAVEAMPQGGEIRIKTEAKENEVLLYFTDTGQGIPRKIKGKIFDPFFTTKGPQASGLGLSVSYGIIKHHQGEIKIDSIKGKGTTFTIRIPVSLEVPSEKGKPRKLQKVSSRNILVIDDEEGVRDVLGRIFEDEGHRVVLAESAREGLERFKQDSSELFLDGLQDNFDVVLTDLGMPEMSGWELARKIKKIDPSMPIGLITGWAVTVTKEEMKEQGIDLILSKPFDYAKVVRKVNTLLKSKKK